MKFVLDEDGKIKGYTTETGGADTVIPFSGEVTDLISKLKQTGKSSFTGSGDWSSKTISVANSNSNYKFGLILITAEVDSYSCPISSVNFNNIDILFGVLNQSPERTKSSFYIGLFATNVSSIAVTIGSKTKASDREYRVFIYTA